MGAVRRPKWGRLRARGPPAEAANRADAGRKGALFEKEESLRAGHGTFSKAVFRGLSVFSAYVFQILLQHLILQ